MKTRLWTLLLAPGLLITSCDDPKKPTKARFKQELDKLYAKGHSVRIRPPEELPATLQDRNVGAEAQKRWDALVTVGLIGREKIVEKEEQMQAPEIYFPGPHDTPRPERPKIYKDIPGNKYIMTDLGKKCLVTMRDGSGERTHWFRCGVDRIREVTSFTEPAAKDGKMTTEVSFTFAAEEIPDWARNPAIAEAYPKLPDLLQKVREDSKTFILTSEGWQVGSNYESIRAAIDGAEE